METVLIIEDNPDNMCLINDLLVLHGYHTIQATTGQQGLDIAHAAKPDFVILDVQLPDINGYEVIKQLRQDSKTAQLKVVAMTSLAMAGDREKLLNAGCNGYIEKPINPATVIAQIKAAIGENNENTDR